MFGPEVSQREHGAGFGHAISGGDVDAALHGLLGQGPRQRRAADDDFPAVEHSFRRPRMGEDHLQDGRDAVGERDLLARDQLEHEVRRIFSEIDLLEAERRRDVRKAPRMHMKHGRNGHVHVAVVETAVSGAGDRIAQRHGMQHQLAMAEVDALGKPGGAGGVERGRPRVLVEVGENEIGVGAREQRFIVGRQRKRRLRTLAAIVEQDERLHAFDSIPDFFEYGQELAVHQDDVVFGVVDGVENLLGRKAHVDGVKGGAHHGNGKEAFKVSVAVQIHDPHGVPGLSSELGEPACQSADAVAEVAVAKARLRAINDFLLGGADERRVQQVLDQQRTGVGCSAAFDQICHNASQVFR